MLVVKELLISLEKPNKPAASGTVSRWIKDEQSREGGNISSYNTYVSGSLFSSKARNTGRSVRDTNKE